MNQKPFFAHSQDSGGHWHGFIRTYEKRGRPLKVELTRNEPIFRPFATPMEEAPFSGEVLDGLYGYHTPAAVFFCKPVAKSLGPSGGNVERATEEVSHSCEWLLKGSYANRNDAGFFDISSAVYDGIESVTRHSFSSFEIGGNRDAFSVCDLLKRQFSLRERATGRRSQIEDSRRARLVLDICYPKPVHVTVHARGHRSLNKLFSLLVGKWYKTRELLLKVNNNDALRTCQLDHFGGWWNAKRPSAYSWVSCDHSGLLEIILNFFYGFEKFEREIDIVLNAIFKNEFIEDKLFWILPLAEERLKKRFGGADVSYIELEKKFFDYMESSEDQDIANFARKNIKTVGKKNKGLKQLLEDARQEIGVKGIELSDRFPEVVSKARNYMMHNGHIRDLNPYETADHTENLVFLMVYYLFIDLGVRRASLTEFFDVWKFRNGQISLDDLAAR